MKVWWNYTRECNFDYEGGPLRPCSVMHRAKIVKGQKHIYESTCAGHVPYSWSFLSKLIRFGFLWQAFCRFMTNKKQLTIICPFVISSWWHAFKIN